MEEPRVATTCMQSVLHECLIFQILASVPLTESGYVGWA